MFTTYYIVKISSVKVPHALRSILSKLSAAVAIARYAAAFEQLQGQAAYDVTHQNRKPNGLMPGTSLDKESQPSTQPLRKLGIRSFSPKARIASRMPADILVPGSRLPGRTLEYPQRVLNVLVFKWSDYPSHSRDISP